jgi:CheY-like chemotaxis protein
MAQVLLVDADEQARSICLKDLVREGHVVQTASTGFEALRLVDEHVPDVVITEVRLPGMDGLDLMGRLLASHRRIRVILVSGSTHYQENFLSWVADACITKSSTTTELRSKLREVLGGSAEHSLGAP